MSSDPPSAHHPADSNYWSWAYINVRRWAKWRERGFLLFVLWCIGVLLAVRVLIDVGWWIAMHHWTLLGWRPWILTDFAGVLGVVATGVVIAAFGWINGQGNYRWTMSQRAMYDEHARMASRLRDQFSDDQ